MKGSKPVIRSRDSHDVSRRHIDPDALKVLYRLNGQGHTAYLVGGGVRDLLLGHEPKDFDIATDAHPNRIRRLFRNAFLIGRRFRLVHIRFGTKIIETSTFRRQPSPDALEDGEFFHKRDNTFGTPEEDAYRRDFTINALFYNVADFTVIDYVGGLRDLDRGLVRCIGDPDIRFKEDPVRMLRAVRFASRFGFSIERRTWRALRQDVEEIRKAAPPRLVEEVYKLFTYRSGAAAFRLLAKAGLRAVMFPELDAFLRNSRAEQRRFDALLRALDAQGDDDAAAPGAELIFAALLYSRFAAEVERRDAAGEHDVGSEIIHGMIENLRERLLVPRAVGYRLVRILDAQHRFDHPPGKRFSRQRFACQETFDDAFALYRIRAAAGAGDPAVVRDWKCWLDQAGPLEKEAPPERPRSRRRGRRGGQRRARR